MHRSIVLLLLGCSLALAYDGQRYNTGEYDLLFEWRTHTADTSRAGTDRHIRFNFGWLNERGERVWTTKNMRYYSGNDRKDRFEKDHEDDFIEKYSDLDYIEARCAQYTQSSTEYLSCLVHPNIVFFELTGEKRLIFTAAEWKLDTLVLHTSLNYRKNGGLVAAEHTKTDFRNTENPDKGWVKPGGSIFYLKESKNDQRLEVKKFK